jgi:gluconate 5-dehydrogenase
VSSGDALQPGFVRDLFRLDGKCALIMGGRGALAEAMAATLADLGCDIALASRRVEECAEIAGRIRDRFKRRTLALRCDTVHEEEVQQTIGKVVGELGAIDVLINNAGTSWWGLPQDIPLSGWKKVVDVNLTGTFLSCRHAARYMIERGSGVIINIASVGAYLSYTPEAGQVVPYTTTKAAIVHLTQDLAAQWAGHGIRVNAIAPGSIRTGMTETVKEDVREQLLSRILLRRFAEPAELAGVVALLASNAGSFITGQTMVVDGGQSIG